MWKKLFGEVIHPFEEIFPFSVGPKDPACRQHPTQSVANVIHQHGAKDIITVFHKPSSSASTRVVTFLKTHQAKAQNAATEDQASSATLPPSTRRADFELDVQEAEPTGDQLKNILEYVGLGKAGTVVQGARDLTDAMDKIKKDASLFQRPVVGAPLAHVPKNRHLLTRNRWWTGIKGRWQSVTTKVRY